MTAARWLPIASVGAMVLARLTELRMKRDTIRGLVRENLTLRLFILVGMLVCAGGIVEFFLREERLRWGTYVPGMLCGGLSFWIRRKAIMALGRFWSLHVEIRANHEFVQSGPFRWIRHPTYFSMILELLAIGLILNAVVALVIGLALFVPILCWRISLEETALLEKFGERYQRYLRTTPALFPYKWPTQ
jgi:protein-S-isoprenylcysteine O-methyltransferase Ste14